MATRNQFDFNRNTWVGLIALILLFVAIYFIATSIFRLLAWLSPLLLLGTVVVDFMSYRLNFQQYTVVKYVKWLADLTKRNTPLGIGAIILTIIGYPVVFGLLFGKALLNRRVKQAQDQVQQRREGEFVDFEELESRRLELPRQEREEPEPQKRADYDDLFKE